MISRVIVLSSREKPNLKPEAQRNSACGRRDPVRGRGPWLLHACAVGRGFVCVTGVPGQPARRSLRTQLARGQQEAVLRRPMRWSRAKNFRKRKRREKGRPVSPVSLLSSSFAHLAFALLSKHQLNLAAPSPIPSQSLPPRRL